MMLTALRDRMPLIANDEPVRLASACGPPVGRFRPSFFEDDATGGCRSSSRMLPLAKNQNTFEKRRREVEKRQRSGDKLERRRVRKERHPSAGAPALVPTDSDNVD